MSVERRRSRRVKASETDLAILLVLYKMLWAHDYHIALLIDEPLSYVTARLKQLAQGGLIGRANLAIGPACNYITADGISALDFEPRSIRIPNMYSYEHSKAEADLYTWLTIALYKKGVRLGDIITDRDIAAAREMTRIFKNGKYVSIPVAKGIHAPDGYIYLGEKVYALEAERVLKSKSSRTRLADNIASNHRRFHGQIWAYEKPAVKHAIERQKEIYGREISLVDIEMIRAEMQGFLEELPKEISRKSERIRRDFIGELRTPTPLNKLPLIQTTEIKLEV